MIKELGYAYMYHYNPYTEEFLCFRRADSDQVFNGTSNSKFNQNQTPLLIGISTVSFDNAAARMYSLIN